MKIRNKLTILFTILTAGLLLIFAVFIYISSSKSREAEFFNNLKKEAVTKANVLLDAKVDAETLQTIYRKNREILSEVEVAIYDPYFNLLYHDAIDIDFVKETQEMIDEIVEKGSIKFTQDNWQVIGYLFLFNDNEYVITAAAYDEYGYNKLTNLRNSLLLAWIVSVIITFAIGKLFSKRALKPVADMVSKVEEITAKNLDLRLNEGKGKDELAELAITFNRMLDRIEDSFEAQKSFVSNIAHEVRTPLSSIITELEWATSKKRTETEYLNCIKDVLKDSQKLSKIITALLDLAKASYDVSKIMFKELRLDELIIDARTEILKNNSNYKVQVNIDSQKEILLDANSYLLKTAFTNIIENACKFSENNLCKIELYDKNNSIVIVFKDEGIGISESEQSKIFKTFYRANNGSQKGTGIGLSLVKKIIDLHKGEIELKSKKDLGTEIKLIFNNS